MSGKSKNYTFSLPVETMESLKSFSEAGDIASVNSVVREALIEYTANLEKKKLAKEMMAAAQDKDFIADLHESMADFTLIDYETKKSRKTEEYGK